MFEHILMPTDFCEPAERALDVAIALAERFGSKLTLLHSYAVPALPYAEANVWPMDLIAAAASKTLEDALAKARARYPDCDGLLQVGSASERILAVAEQSGADLIVMGTHGRRGGLRFLLGSVTEQVVHLSPVPVLTVREGDTASETARHTGSK